MIDPTDPAENVARPDWDLFRRKMIEARRQAGLSEAAMARVVGWRNGEVVRAFERGEVLPTAPVMARMVDTFVRQLTEPASGLPAPTLHALRCHGALSPGSGLGVGGPRQSGPRREPLVGGAGRRAAARELAGDP